MRLDAKPVKPETFLFVHGLWHGGWIWDDVVQRMQGAGHNAIAMNLPGRAGDPTPPESITLATHANAIASVARRAVARTPGEPERRVILVAHSTTGVYITQAAESCPEAVKKLVYVSALVPKNGQSAAQLQAMGGRFGGGQVGQYVVREPPYVFLKTGVPLEALFYGGVPPSVVARAKAMLVPEPMRPLGDPVSITDANFGSISREYIGFQGDAAIPPAFQEFICAETQSKFIGMPGSHSGWLADPGALVRALLADFGGTADLSPPPPPLSAFK